MDFSTKPDILYYIVQFIDISDWNSISLTCKYWNNLTKTNFNNRLHTISTNYVMYFNKSPILNEIFSSCAPNLHLYNFNNLLYDLTFIDEDTFDNRNLNYNSLYRDKLLKYNKFLDIQGIKTYLADNYNNYVYTGKLSIKDEIIRHFKGAYKACSQLLYTLHHTDKRIKFNLYVNIEKVFRDNTMNSDELIFRRSIYTLKSCPTCLPENLLIEYKANIREINRFLKSHKIYTKDLLKNDIYWY